MVSASTVTDIIMHICTGDTTYREICDNIAPKLKEDAWQEMMLILLEHNPQKLIDSWNNKFFKYLFIRIMMNQFKSNSSRIYRTYTRFGGDENADISKLATEIKDEDDIEFINNFNNDVNNFVEEQFWYDKELFKMYYYDGYSYSQISKLTKIPKNSIWQNVRNTTDRLKEFLNKN